MLELKTVSLTFIWIALIIGAYVAYKRHKLNQLGKNGQSDTLTVIKAIHTGPKEKIMVVRWNNTAYLVSNTPVSSTLLDKSPIEFSVTQNSTFEE